MCSCIGGLSGSRKLGLYRGLCGEALLYSMLYDSEGIMLVRFLGISSRPCNIEVFYFEK